MSEVVVAEAAGLIVRTRCDEDRRQQEITLTDSGRRRAEELIEKRRAFEGEGLALPPTTTSGISLSCSTGLADNPKESRESGGVRLCLKSKRKTMAHLSLGRSSRP